MYAEGGMTVKREFRSTVTDIAIVLLCGALIFTVAWGITDRRAVQTVGTEAPCILIDPGHGGADGGAEAPDGTLEKDLNLAVSLPLRDVLTVMGYTVQMTRTADVMLNTEGETLRERKVSDIHNRLAMVESADLTVSIHQNKFAQSQYYGTQIFYSPNTDESRVLADSVREQVVGMLQPENTRELKRGTADVYLLHHATRPMILVECGFLSNQTELAKLKDAAYQRQMAFAVAAGVMTYF